MPNLKQVCQICKKKFNEKELIYLEYTHFNTTYIIPVCSKCVLGEEPKPSLLKRLTTLAYFTLSYLLLLPSMIYKSYKKYVDEGKTHFPN